MKIRLREVKPSHMGLEAGKEASPALFVPKSRWSLRARGIGRGESDERKPEGVEPEWVPWKTR